MNIEKEGRRPFLGGRIVHMDKGGRKVKAKMPGGAEFERAWIEGVQGG